MLRCINGLETIDAGEIRFDGQPVDPSRWTGAPWTVVLRDGRTVQLRIRGRDHDAVPTVIQDTETFARYTLGGATGDDVNEAIVMSAFFPSSWVTRSPEETSTGSLNATSTAAPSYGPIPVPSIGPVS